MSDTSVIPASLTVRNLLEDLLGRDVTVQPGDPLERADLPKTVVAVYVDRAQQIAGVLGLDLTLAAHAGAALGLMPVGAAEDAIDEKALPPLLAENVSELCNVLTSLINREGMPHVKLHQVVLPGQTLPSDAAAHLLALGRRLDLRVEVSRYGGGRFALSLAP
jgi:hypothetical protein